MSTGYQLYALRQIIIWNSRNYPLSLAWMQMEPNDMPSRSSSFVDFSLPLNSTSYKLTLFPLALA